MYDESGEQNYRWEEDCGRPPLFIYSMYNNICQMY